MYAFKFFRHSGVPGGKQSPVTVGAGYQGDPSAMANRPLAELCKLLLLFEWNKQNKKNFFEKSEEHKSRKLMKWVILKWLVCSYRWHYVILKQPVLTSTIFIDPTLLGVGLVRDTTHLMSLLWIFSLETGERLVCMFEDCVFGLIALTQSHLYLKVVLFCL